MKQKIVFFGSGDYSIPVIEMLTHHGLELVLTTETDQPSHKASARQAPTLINYLELNSIPYLSTKVTADKKISKQELWEKVENFKPTLGILASFGAIIPQHIIDLFENGIWNIHPSLLPKYKGPSPIQYTLLSGDSVTGVSIITLDDQVDHGPILSQESVSLSGSETTQQLKTDLFAKGAHMIELLLKNLEENKPVKAVSQNHEQETWTEKITKEKGRISLENLPEPELLKGMIRAYFPWPTIMFEWPINEKKKLVKLLPDNKIQIEGKNVMSYKDFINGYGENGKELLEKLRLL